MDTSSLSTLTESNGAWFWHRSRAWFPCSLATTTQHSKVFFSPSSLTCTRFKPMKS